MDIIALQKAIEALKMEDDDSLALINEMTKKLVSEYRKKVEEVHTNRWYQIADGRWKTKNPQIVKKTEEELIEALYIHYYGKQTIESIYPKFLEEFTILVTEGHRAYESLRRYKIDWNRFLQNSDISKVSITSITKEELHNFYAQISANRSISRTQLGNVKALVNHIFRYASNHGLDVIDSKMVYTDDLVCKQIDNSSCVYTNAMREKILTQAEKENNIYSKAIIFMFCTCCRISELRALSWDDINFEKKQVYIHSQIVNELDSNGCRIYVKKPYTKGKKESGKRVLPLSKRAIDTLLAIKVENPDGEFVFLSDKETVLDIAYFDKMLKKICTKVNVPYFSSHKIRFWAISEMYKSGMSTSQIMPVAGHSTNAMTEHYRRSVSPLVPIDNTLISSVFN